MHIFYELSISTDYPAALVVFFLLNGIFVSLLAKAIFVSSNIPSSKKFSPSLPADFTTTLHSHRHCDCSVWTVLAVALVRSLSICPT